MRRRNRIDTSQPALVARVKALGAEWLPWPGGTIDGMILWRGRVMAVDFKSQPNDPLTPRQARLVTRGWPIFFPRTEEDIDRMLGIHHDMAPVGVRGKDRA